jgi:trimeric autotransporter adhesin
MRNGYGGFGIALLVALLWLAAPAAAQVVINEVLASPGRDWNGDGTLSSRDDEWVEVYNAGDQEVSIDGYRLADADTSWRFEFSGTLAPGATRLVYGGESYAWEKATKHGAYGLSLNNGGDTVRLWKFTGPDSVQVDVMVYGALEGGSDRSVGRFPDGRADFKVFDSLNPMPAGSNPPGTACAPSPGGQNGCPTAVQPFTWGALRVLFGPEEHGGAKPKR